jgi:hypothetical protein
MKVSFFPGEFRFYFMELLDSFFLDGVYF